MTNIKHKFRLKDFLDEAEQKNSIPKKASRFTTSEDSFNISRQEIIRDPRWARKKFQKNSGFKKPHRDGGNFNSSCDSLDGSPTPERQHTYFQHPNVYNKPKDNSDNTDSIKNVLERMFQQHSNMVNTKLNTIIQKVNHFSSEVVRLKNINEELQKSNKMLMKLLEEGLKNGVIETQLKKKAVASEKKITKSCDELDQLLKKTTVINSSKSTNSKPVTSPSALERRNDESSSDESIDTESFNQIEILKSDLITLYEKSDPALTSNIHSSSPPRPTIDNNITKKNPGSNFKKDLAIGAKKKQSLIQIPEVERLMELAGEKIIWTSGTFSCDKCGEGFIDCSKGDGVILQQCVHTFCRVCIYGHILKNKVKDEIDCPYPGCDFNVQEGEIEELLGHEKYKARLDQQASNIQEHIEGAKQCRSKGCRGFVSVEKGVFDFVCPVCQYTNCLDCNKIHADGTTCRKLADLNTEVSDTDPDSPDPFSIT